MKIHIPLLCSAMLCMSCSEEVQVTRQATTMPPAVIKPPAAVAETVRRLAADHGIRFTAWQGKPRGMDSDFRILLRGDGSMRLDVDGVGPMTYEGTFTLGPAGRIVTSIPSYRGGWPVMMVKQESGVLKLYREDGVTSLFPDSPRVDGFWPFVAD